MADKKAKEEVTQSPKQEAEVSNIAEKIGESPVASPTMDDYNSSALNAEAAEKMMQEIRKATTVANPHAEAYVVDTESKPTKDEKPKLYVLAADRLNSLINEANELGITDIVQILNSDRTGQFYLVYKE